MLQCGASYKHWMPQCGNHGGHNQDENKADVLKEFSFHSQMLHLQKILVGSGLLTCRYAQSIIGTQMKSRALQESFLKEMRPKLSLEKRVKITFMKKDGEVQHEPPQAETWNIKHWCLLAVARYVISNLSLIIFIKICKYWLFL